MVLANPEGGRARVGGLDGPGQLYAVHAGHLHVQHREVVRLSGRAELFQGFLTAFDGRGLYTPGRELFLQDGAVGAIVVDHQCPSPGEVHLHAPRGGGVLALLFQGHGKGEGTAAARFALYSHLPAHQGHELFADGEP